MPEKSLTSDEKLQQEFNRWAAAGEGANIVGMGKAVCWCAWADAI
jgi:hypothetical protein